MDELASALQRLTLDAPTAGQGPAAAPQSPPTAGAGGCVGAAAAGAAAAAGSHASTLASIHDLPDDLLSRCLVEAGRQEG